MRRFLILIAVCALMPVAAAAASGAVSGKFTGKTSQGSSVTIKVVSGTLEHSSLKWSATCTTPGTTLRGTTVLTGLMSSGRYKHKEVYTVPVKSGVKAKHTATAWFAVQGKHLHGWFKLVAVVFSKPGTIMATCTTPKVTFSAHS
jgi:hypothetical protein